MVSVRKKGMKVMTKKEREIRLLLEKYFWTINVALSLGQKDP